MTHQIIVDTIVRATGPGWTLAKARLLIDNAGNAALFTPPKGSAPVQVFTADAAPRQALRGTGVQVLSNGDEAAVTYQRVGTSCAYALAKCNTKSPTLVQAWDAYDAQTGKAASGAE